MTASGGGEVPGARRMSDLTRARDEIGEVLAVEELDGGLIELTARLPSLARTAQPGEFAQLRCGDGLLPLLRRPFSVAWTEDDRCAFVFERVGVGTRCLAELRPGDPLQALGPLGIGFSLPDAPGRVLCVAGGLGCAPFPLAARAARGAGAAEVVVVHGAATAARLYPAARFARGDGAITVREATDDGSRGHHGFVTELVAAEVAAGVDAIWACGPNPMLGALAQVLADLPSPAIVEASMEAPMGCGFGTCLGCALPVRGDGAPLWALCCREGPVMRMDAVDWEALRQLPPAHVA